MTDLERWIDHFDHNVEDYAENPFPIWAALREQCPVAHSDQHGGFWIPTRYEDIEFIASTPATFSSRRQAVPDLFGGGQFPPYTSDPPNHAAPRRVLLPQFAPKRIASFEPFAWETVAGLIDSFGGRERIDGSRDYARLVSAKILTRILGVDPADADLITDWIGKLTEGGVSEPEAAAVALQEVSAYLLRTTAEHRVNPGDDVISYLIEAAVEGAHASDAELLPTLIPLLAAGIDTTWRTLASSLHYLAVEPDDRQRLVAALDNDPSNLWALAVEEFLRAFAPVTMARCVTSQVEFGGRQLGAGDMVLLPFPAANRDPEVFVDPDEVVIDRAVNRHFAFGVGIHRCLGSNLARMELRVGLQAFLRHFPEFSIPDGVEIKYTPGAVRGPVDLPLIIQASDRS